MTLFVHERPDPEPVPRFSSRDLEAATNDIILAMDGNIRRADAILCARAAFRSKGMEPNR